MTYPAHKTIALQSDFSRRFPDPLNQTEDQDFAILEHYVLLCKAIHVPKDIPTDPNPRDQKIDTGIYKIVTKSLEDGDDPTFHLKNKGITLLARRVEQSNDKKTANVILGERDGIVDGAHTYKIILDCITRGVCPENQYVKIEIITGVPASLVTDLAGGLNTAVQVQPASLMNLDHDFDWLKAILKGEPYADKIAYKENEDEKEYDVREIVGFLTLFNVGLFDDKSHPKEAYTSKAKCLERYLRDYKNGKTYEKLAPIVKDILQLHDHVHLQAREQYNRQLKGHAAALKGVFNTRKRGKHSLVFSGQESESILHDGALYPILGALRFLVVEGPEGKYAWRVGSFKEVKRLFDRVAHELVQAAYRTSLVYGRKSNPVGKDDNLWTTLYKTVALEYFSKAEAARAKAVAKPSLAGSNV